MPNVPVITEETYDAFEARQGSSLPDRFILVDPLDGTREFVAGRDEFTVNIALIEAGQPIAGTIFAPALCRLYVAGADAYMAEVRPEEPLPGLETMRPLTTGPRARRGTARNRQPLAPRSGDTTMA